jgi:hypothetical protein
MRRNGSLIWSPNLFGRPVKIKGDSMRYWLKTTARLIQLIGLLITLNVVLLFFTDISMGPLLGLTTVGVLTFWVGWLMFRLG